MKRFFTLCIIAIISLVMILVIEKISYKPKQVELITLGVGKISLKNVTEEEAYVYVDFEYKNVNSNKTKSITKLFVIHTDESIVINSEVFGLDNDKIRDVLINVYDKDIKRDVLEPIKPYFIGILTVSSVWILVIVYKVKRRRR